MSLPIVIIFERHWDEVPKHVVGGLLPSLVEQGYDTLCFEFPQNLKSSEIIARHSSGLELDSDLLLQAEKLLRQVNITKNLSALSFSELAELMRLYVSSQKYFEVAEKIKQLPASKILKNIFDSAKKLSVSVKGVDIDEKDFYEMILPNITKRLPSINKYEASRINTIFENLLKLKSEQEGVIFVCGSYHARNLIRKFTEKNMQDDVLYYFPHSEMRFDERVDDANEVLKGHTHLLSKEGIKSFNERIVKEILPKMRYKNITLDDNSQSRFLNEFFSANFKIFMRAGYYVDALLDIDETSNIETIKQKLEEGNIQTRYTSLHGRSFLVIPNVNTQEVAQRILKLK